MRDSSLLEVFTCSRWPKHSNRTLTSLHRCILGLNLTLFPKDHQISHNYSFPKTHWGQELSQICARYLKILIHYLNHFHSRFFSHPLDSRGQDYRDPFLHTSCACPNSTCRSSFVSSQVAHEVLEFSAYSRQDFSKIQQSISYSTIDSFSAASFIVDSPYYDGESQP